MVCFFFFSCPGICPTTVRSMMDIQQEFLDDDQGLKTSDELFTHTENFGLLDTDRRLRAVCNGLDPSSMQALVRDIRVRQQRS